jgi:hypothetical protein
VPELSGPRAGVGGFSAQENTMEFKTQWRKNKDDSYLSQTFSNVKGAKQWAYKRISEGIEDICVMDQMDNIVVSYEQLKLLMKEEFDR